MEFAALHAVIAEDTAVELVYLFAARRLMKSVDILRDNGAELSLLFPFRKLEMRGIRLCAETVHLRAIEAVKLLRFLLEKCVAEYGLGRVIPLLTVQAVNTAEVGYAALGGNSGSAEKYYPLRVICYFFKLPNFVRHFQSPMTFT